MKTSRKGSTTPQERQFDTIKLIQAYAAPRCHHLKTNGLRCASPALRQARYCFFHNNLRTAPQEIVVLALEDHNAVQLVLQQVVRGVLNGLLEPKTAGLALYGLQIASANLKHTRFEPLMHDGCTDPATLATLYDPSGSGVEPDYWDDDSDEDQDDQDDDDENELDQDDDDRQPHPQADDEPDEEDEEPEDDEDGEKKNEAEELGDTTPASAQLSGSPTVQPAAHDPRPSAFKPTLPGPQPATTRITDVSAIHDPLVPFSLVRAAIEELERPRTAPDDRPALSDKALRKYRKLLKSLNAPSSRPATND